MSYLKIGMKKKLKMKTFQMMKWVVKMTMMSKQKMQSMD